MSKKASKKVVVKVKSDPNVVDLAEVEFVRGGRRGSRYEETFAKVERLPAGKGVRLLPKGGTWKGANSLRNYLSLRARKRSAPAGKRFAFAITTGNEIVVRLEAVK